MQFNGGNVIECAFVYPVFVGTKWQDNQTWAALAGDLQLFMSDIFQSTYVSTLDQYGFLAGIVAGLALRRRTCKFDAGRRRRSADRRQSEDPRRHPGGPEPIRDER
jgi:hypothetical protein